MNTILPISLVNGLFLCLIILTFILLASKITNKKGTWNNKIYQLPDFSDLDSVGHLKKDSSSKGELECRKIMEKIFDAPFKKARPYFLKNPITGSNLEIDCYNEDYKIGVEYNGEQHYKYTPWFHKSKEDFYNTKYRDEIKKKLCKDNDIHLIVVPYTVKNIEKFILEELRING